MDKTRGRAFPIRPFCYLSERKREVGGEGESVQSPRMNEAKETVTSILTLFLLNCTTF